MTSQEIRSMPTDVLRAMVNGMAHTDRTSRLIAQGEIERRKREAK